MKSKPVASAISNYTQVPWSTFLLVQNLFLIDIAGGGGQEPIGSHMKQNLYSCYWIKGGGKIAKSRKMVPNDILVIITSFLSGSMDSRLATDQSW